MADLNVGESEIVLSPNKTVVVRDLNGNEYDDAIKLSRNFSSPAVVLASRSIVSLNGVPLVVQNDCEANIRHFLSTLKGREYNALVNEYAKTYVLSADELERIKNG